MERFQKDVRVWSSRQKRPVRVHVDFARIDTGDFQLFHIARIQDDRGHDTLQDTGERKAIFEQRRI